MVHAVDREFRTVMVLLRRFLKVAECLIGVLFHSRSGQINAPQLEKGMSVMLLRRFFIALDGLLIVGVRGLFTGKQKICFRNPVLRRFFFSTGGTDGACEFSFVTGGDCSGDSGGFTDGSTCGGGVSQGGVSAATAF